MRHCDSLATLLTVTLISGCGDSTENLTAESPATDSVVGAPVPAETTAADESPAGPQDDWQSRTIAILDAVNAIAANQPTDWRTAGLQTGDYLQFLP